jgi:hypothetical protein
MSESPKSQRTEILVLLSVLIVGPPLFVGRAQLRLPLHPAELEVLVAAQSLAADRDLAFEPKDQARLSRHHFEALGPLPSRRIALEQPLYSLVVGPLALALGDRGPILLNAVVLVLLLWWGCQPAGPEPDRFWWGLTYFLICAYPVLVWRIDEAVLLGGALALVLHRWGEERPEVSGSLLGLLVPRHLWILPLAGVVAWRRGWRFRGALAIAATVLFAALALVPPEPVGVAQEPRLALVAAEAPEQAVAWRSEPLGLPPAVASARPVLFLFGRIQGVVPYFLPWLVGLCRYLGYERRRGQLLVLAGLLASLALSELALPATAMGPAHPGLGLLLPAFFLFSRPVLELRGLVGIWSVSSLFCAVLFLTPIHSASRPAEVLGLGPHRLLPLELGRLDPQQVPQLRLGDGSWRVALPTRDAWVGPEGTVQVRGKRWGAVVLSGPAGEAPPQLVLRAPVDLELELRAGAQAARLSLGAGARVRVRLPESVFGAAGAARWGTELWLRPSSGLVPRLELDGGDGVDYVGAEVSFVDSGGTK